MRATGFSFPGLQAANSASSQRRIFELIAALCGTIRALLARRLLDKFRMTKIYRRPRPMKARVFAVKRGHLPTAKNRNPALNFAKAIAFCDDHFRKIF
jgi:hypothetical protein